MRAGSGGVTHLCPVCGEANAVPDSWGSPARKKDDIPEVLPADADEEDSPPAPLQWDSVMIRRREEGGDDARGRQARGRPLFGKWPWSKRNSRTKGAAAPVGLRTLVLIVVGLVILVLAIFAITASVSGPTHFK